MAKQPLVRAPDFTLGRACECRGLWGTCRQPHQTLLTWPGVSRLDGQQRF